MVEYKTIGGSALGIAIIAFAIMSGYVITDHTYYCPTEPEKLVEAVYGVSGGSGTRLYLTPALDSWDNCKDGWKKALLYVNKVESSGNKFYIDDYGIKPTITKLSGEERLKYSNIIANKTATCYYDKSLNISKCESYSAKYQKGNNTLIIEDAIQRRVTYEDDKAKVETTLYWDVYGDGSNYNNTVNELSVSINGNKFKYGGNHTGLNSSSWERFKYISKTSNSITLSPKGYLFGNHLLANYDDICTKIGLNNQSANCSYLSYSVVDNQTNSSYNYLEITFFSNNIIDPTFTVVASSSNIFNVNTRTEPNNITHLLPSTITPYDSLVAYYSFDSDGYLPNAWVQGNVTGNNALNISRTTNQYIAVPNSNSLSFGNGTKDSPVSMSAWVYINNASAFTIFDKGGPGQYEYSLGTGINNRLYFSMYDLTGNQYIQKSTTGTITSYENTWTHIVATYSGNSSVSGMDLYINGVLQTSVTSLSSGGYIAMNHGNDVISIGRYENGLYYSSGKFGESVIFNRTLSQAEITSMYLNETQGIFNSYDRTGLKLELNLNNSKGTLAVDNSGLGNNGILANFPIGAYDFTNRNNDGTYVGNATNTNGLYDYGAKFNGQTDYISIPDSTSLDITDNLTLSSWVYFDKIGTVNVIASKRTGATTNYQLWVDTDNKIYFGSNGGSWTTANTDATVTSGRWYHITSVYNDATNTVDFYINGSLSVQKAFAASLSANVGNLFIGRDGDSGTSYYNGSIDEVMIFNNALNSSQVLQIYQNTSQRFNPTGTATIKFQNITADGNNSINLSVSILENNYATNNSVRIGSWNVSYGYDNTNTSLIGYYHADNSANDSSGNNNNGTFVGGVTLGRGLFNNSFVFDGTSGSITVPANTYMNNLTEFTIATWANLNPQADHTLCDKRDATTDSVICLVDAQTMYLRINALDWSWSTMVANKTWVHLVWAYNGSTMMAYYNGVRDVDHAIGKQTIDTTVPFQIGQTASTLQLNGSIDEYMFFNRSLSTNEIKELYVKGRTANVGVNWTYGAYGNITQPNTNVSLSFTPYATHILPDFMQSSTPATQFYTPLFGGTIRLDSYETAGAPVDNPPVVTFNTPANGTTTVNNPVFYAYNHTDDTALVNTTHYLWNATGIVATNYSAITGVANFTNLSMAFSNQGVYLYNAYTCDSLNQCAWATVNRSIYYDTLAPVFSNMAETPTDPATYANGQFYEFNVTIVEGQSAVNTAVIEFNGVNYTTATNQVLNRGSGVYTFNRTDLGAGTYNYYWYANDSAGNSNQTASQSYTISKATGDNTQSNQNQRTNILGQTGSIFRLNTTLITGQWGGAFLNLTENGVQLAWNQTSDISILRQFSTQGTFIINGSYSGNTNYTGDYEIWNVTTYNQVINASSLQLFNTSTIDTNTIIFNPSALFYDYNNATWAYSIDGAVSVPFTLGNAIVVADGRHNITFSANRTGNFSAIVDTDMLYNFNVNAGGGAYTCDIRGGAKRSSANRVFISIGTLAGDGTPDNHGVSIDCYSSEGASIATPTVVSLGTGRYLANLTNSQSGLCYIVGNPNECGFAVVEWDDANWIWNYVERFIHGITS